MNRTGYTHNARNAIILYLLFLVTRIKGTVFKCRNKKLKDNKTLHRTN